MKSGEKGEGEQGGCEKGRCEWVGASGVSESGVGASQGGDKPRPNDRRAWRAALLRGIYGFRR